MPFKLRIILFVLQTGFPRTEANLQLIVSGTASYESSTMYLVADCVQHLKSIFLLQTKLYFNMHRGKQVKAALTLVMKSMVDFIFQNTWVLEKIKLLRKNNVFKQACV